MMLCVVINGPSLKEAEEQIVKALECADLVELRLDTFTKIDIDALRQLCMQFVIPMIFTLRRTSQDGSCIEENKRLANILQLAELNPEYIDLEIDVPLSFFEEFTVRYPKIKLIISYHNFYKTPKDDELNVIYQHMQQIPAEFYKIAVTAHNTLDALRFLCWTKKYDKLIAVSMGPYGQVSRILAPIMGYPFTYACLDENNVSAPGQISVSTLMDRYRCRTLSPHTALYGLIGDPITGSVSDHTHNRFFGILELDAVYVKMPVTIPELPEFLKLATQLAFQGLSVTMPLKECIMPYLGSIDPEASEIGAVNTLVRQENGFWQGFNTDGIGALNAIQKMMSIEDKKIIILGAGGAAKAIAYEAHRRGAILTIVNRDIAKAKQLAQKFQASTYTLEQMSLCTAYDCDLLINCTPLPMPITLEAITPDAIIMDIRTRPIETPFLQSALEKGCRIIPGYHMFIEQALGQFNLWFNPVMKELNSKN